MKNVFLFFLFLFFITSVNKVIAFGIPFGTPRVTWISPFTCLNGGFMIKVQPPAGGFINTPPGPYFVPIGSNRYMGFIYPPVPGTKMLGWWIPGGVCLKPSPWGPTPIYTVGIITGYGSALGF